jgi:hypothetical protein
VVAYFRDLRQYFNQKVVITTVANSDPDDSVLTRVVGLAFGASKGRFFGPFEAANRGRKVVEKW